VVPRPAGLGARAAGGSFGDVARARVLAAIVARTALHRLIHFPAFVIRTVRGNRLNTAHVVRPRVDVAEHSATPAIPHRHETGPSAPSVASSMPASADPFFASCAIFTSARNTSATLHACAMHPRGVNGGVASKISLIDPTHASCTWERNPSSACSA